MSEHCLCLCVRGMGREREIRQHKVKFLTQFVPAEVSALVIIILQFLSNTAAKKMRNYNDEIMNNDINKGLYENVCCGRGLHITFHFLKEV